jgi:hypothetical protein
MNFTKIHEVHTEIRKDFKKRKLVPLRFLFANLYETAIEKKYFTKNREGNTVIR